MEDQSKVAVDSGKGSLQIKSCEIPFWMEFCDIHDISKNQPQIQKNSLFSKTPSLSKSNVLHDALKVVYFPCLNEWSVYTEDWLNLVMYRPYLEFIILR